MIAPFEREAYEQDLVCRKCGKKISLKVRGDQAATDAILLWIRYGERCAECRKKENQI